MFITEANAAHGYICKLCTYYQNYTVIMGEGEIFHLLLLFHMRPANQVTLQGVTTCHKRLEAHGIQ